uniref:Uncharacterized protein n=1 Tax=Apoglossum ruscifolium TaxID=167976 RepID=A0A4D6WP06_9FLOR|nr:hypothetical protein [Apoglossum ruscifolium]
MIILKELEKIILDIIELNLNKAHLKQLNYKIFDDFITKVSKHFTSEINNTNNIKFNRLERNKSIYNNNDYYYSILLEYKFLLNNILTYLIFGSIDIDETIFMFNKFYTPYNHVQILFENFILQISNYVINYIFNQFSCLSDIIKFLQINEICSYSYISIRSIALYFNNLNWQNLVYLHIYQPKSIYSANYRVSLLSSKGMITKHIYLSRLENLNQLSKIKIILLFMLETKDIIIPKIEKLLIITTKYLIYIFINLFSNIIILAIRIILSYIRK